eukprot:gene1991-3873_t
MIFSMSSSQMEVYGRPQSFIANNPNLGDGTPMARTYHIPEDAVQISAPIPKLYLGMDDPYDRQGMGGYFTKSVNELDIFKSTDGGITWTSCKCNVNYAPSSPIPGLQINLDISGDQGWYDQLLLLSKPSMLGTHSWSVLSTWYNNDFYKTKYGLSYLHADFHTAAYTTTSAGVGTLIFGNDGGLGISQDNGVTWTTDVNVGLVTQLPNFICRSSLFSNRLMLGSQDLGTIERNDSTTNWYVTGGGDGDGCAYSQAVNKVNIMSVYYNSFTCRYYSNGGFGPGSDCFSGITEVQGDTPFYNNLATPSATADPTGTIFFTLTNKRVYRSSMPSGSIVWTAIGTVGSNGISIGDIRDADVNIGLGSTTDQIAFAKNADVYITTNGGSTWFNPNTGTKLPDTPIGKLLVSNTDATGNTVFAGQTSMPTSSPTRLPSLSPTSLPTPSPTFDPTMSPTTSPTTSPTRSPSISPTPSLTTFPTRSPTTSPTRSPNTSKSPTIVPTGNPIIATKSPSTAPTPVREFIIISNTTETTTTTVDYTNVIIAVPLVVGGVAIISASAYLLWRHFAGQQAEPALTLTPIVQTAV